MNVKEQLKELNITQSDFAEELGISRPTLDSYMSLYDSGEIIPKDRFEIILHRLFDGEITTKEAFLQKLRFYKELLNRDNRLGITDIPADDADTVSTIVDLMIRDMKSAEYSRELYKFIEMLLFNYRRQELFRIIAEYFVAFNDEANYEIKEKQIPYFANIYACMQKIKGDSVKYREQDYEAFLRRRMEVRQEQVTKENAVKLAISKKVEEIINKAKKDGIALTEEQIMERLKND